MRLVAPRAEHGHRLVAAGRQHDVTTDADGVAGKAEGVGLSDRQAARQREPLLDDLTGVAVEGGRVVEDLATSERAEACVEVIPARVHQLDYEGKRYNFCTPVCKWIFEQEPARYKDFETIVDRMYSGEIDPPTLPNVLTYMGIGVISNGGRDGYDYRWIDGYRKQAAE